MKLVNNNTALYILNNVNIGSIEITNNFTKVIREKQKSLLINFSIPFIYYFEKRLDECFTNYNFKKIKIDIDNIKSTIMYDITSNLTSISIRTLIYTLHQFKDKGYIHGKDEIDQYNNFHDYLSSKNVIEEILKQYPVLEFLIGQTINSRLNFINEIIDNFQKDISILETLINERIQSINNIELGAGDTHNNGKSVSFIEVNNNQKVLYKPHSMRTNDLFNRVIDFINNNGSLSVKLPKINHINRGYYGWQEYVKPSTCYNEEQVFDYYKKIGAFLAVFHVLKTEDLHHENLIASDSDPFIVDLETLVKNEEAESVLTNEIIKTYSQELSSSVISTCLLPYNISNSVFDFDLGGISNSDQTESNVWSSFQIVDSGTSSLRLEKIKGQIPKTQNRVSLNNKYCNPAEYTKQIISGFNQTFEYLGSNKHALFHLIRDEIEHPIKIRQVLRATAVYVKFLEASLHPKYLKSFKDRQKLFSKLKQNKSQDVAEKEISALMINDVPYFCEEINSNDLICNQDESMIINYFSKTPLDLIWERFNNISIKEQKKQSYFIEAALSTSSSNPWNSNRNKYIFYKNKHLSFPSKKNERNKREEFVMRIANYMIDIAARNKSTKTSSWLIASTNSDKIKISPADYNLYEGGGMILFLLYAGKYFNNKRLIESSEEFLNFSEELSKLNDSDGIGYFSGKGSLAYLYYNFYKVTQKNYFRDKFYESITSILLKKNKKYDVINGISGTLIFLLNVYEENNEFQNDKGIINIINQLTRNLFKKVSCIKEDDPLWQTGLAHGLAGLSWALIKSGSVLGNLNYISAGERLVDLENKYFSTDTNNWLDLRPGNRETDISYWCYGAPGIGLSRAKSIKYIKSLNYREKFKRDIERSVRKMSEQTALTDHSVCHGSFGVAEVLATMGQELKNSSIIQSANCILEDSIYDFMTDGFKSGVQGGTGIATYMLGFSGVGYSVLRFLDNNIPSIIAMDI